MSTLELAQLRVYGMPINMGDSGTKIACSCGAHKLTDSHLMAVVWAKGHLFSSIHRGQDLAGHRLTSVPINLEGASHD